MKTPLLLLYWLISLHPAFKKPQGLIDQQDTHYWMGSQEDNTYKVLVDSTQGVWFIGRLVINDQDTLHLKGFEKGNNHPTEVGRANGTDSIEYLGHVFIWALGRTADSVELKNERDTLAQLPTSIKLHKKAKKH